MKALSLFLLLLLFHLSFVSSWKKDEFRNCNQTPFCKRARSRVPGSCNLVASDVRIDGGVLTAKLLPKALEEGKEKDEESGKEEKSEKPLLVKISAYQDGILRFKIDEDPSLNPPKKRFEPPEVIVPEFENTKLWLQQLSTVHLDGDVALSSIVYLSDDHEAVLRHDPFEIFVRLKNTGETLVSINSRGLFDFEQLREKKEGEGNAEDWEERFRSHIDTRPYGPQSISFDVSFHGSDFVYGIPEHASTSLALKPTKGPGVDFSEPYRLFNLDVFEYEHDSPFGIYGSIPFMLAHGRTPGRPPATTGFFWLNAAEMQIDVFAPGWEGEHQPAAKQIDTLWMSEAGIVDGFFFVGPTPKDVLRQYTSVTGKPAMPQHFATAYHQCRWNYRDEEDVAEVDSKFDEFDIPYDVLWLDIEHTDGRRYFTWDRVLFPNPEQMQRNLAAKGRHMVTIVDPHIKRDASFHIHKEATQKGYYVKDSSGKDFDGWCWSGSSSYPDVLNPKVRSWWAQKFSLDNYGGSTPTLYIWNDMNEPSVFNGPEITMPRDAVHYGGVEHRELHNAYGYYFHMASTEGLIKRGDGNVRPFVLARAFFAGSQRVGAVWTGDNTADWDHLKASVPMILTLGLTGISFSGADVGGYFGNPGTELLVRWYQLGAYYPFFRGHAHQDTRRREPWLFGDGNTAMLRDAIRTRYTLLPYFYTLFKEASSSGIPVMRPLWMEFPSDEATFNNGDAFMVGNSLLVQGIYEEGAKHTSVYLPGEQSWYNLRNGAAYSGGRIYKLEVNEESIPCFQKAGTIVPRRDRSRRSTTQMAHDPYTLVIALNSSLAAEGELYIDDGKSFDYKQGAYIHRHFLFSDGKLKSSDLSPANSGRKLFSSDCIIERIILLGHPSGPKGALIEPASKKVEVELGPLMLRRGSKPVALVIRKPDVQVTEDWTISIL